MEPIADFDVESPELWETVFELGSIAAGRVHRRFGKWTTLDDLRQAGLEYAWRRRDLVAQFLNREDPAERRRGESALIRTMSRAAERYARKEKAEQSGYDVDDEQYYTGLLVEGLIQAWGFGDADLAGQVLDPAEMRGRGKRLASEGNTMLAMLADIDKAMKSLDGRTYGVLRLRLVEGKTLAQVGRAWGISPTRVDQIYRAGIRKVIEYLGGERP